MICSYGDFIKCNVDKWILGSFLDILFFNISRTANISDFYKKYYFLKEHDEVFHMDIALIYLGFLLSSAQICKIMHYFGQFKGP